MPVENGERIKLIRDVATLKVEIATIKDKQKEYHEDLKDEIVKLREKVNHEITDINTKVSNVMVKMVKWVAIAFAISSFVYIKESRDWIAKVLF